MRRRHATVLPALASTFGVRPWEIELLTPAEFVTLVAACRKS